ncbi:MAG TPA: catalase, partial [Myxococcota bacterium]|nr:catalase [Myxococcota bacterium]
VVPGIDFTNDPLLQGRLFSYTDTQLKRLGGPNFHEIPINRPIAPVHNNQRDGHMRQTLNRGKVSYEPNSIGGGCPMQARTAAGGFATFPERLEGAKVRARSEKFFDHFSQATLFFESQSAPEQDHIVEALRFELGKVERAPIRERMVAILNLVHEGLAARVAEGLGFREIPRLETPINHSIPGDGPAAAFEPRRDRRRQAKSPALSMAGTVKNTIATRRVAILAADGVDAVSLARLKTALEHAGASGKVVAPRLGTVRGEDETELLVDFTFLTASSVLFDAVYVPGGRRSVAALVEDRDAIAFVTEAYRHCKPIAATTEGVDLLRGCAGILTGKGGEGSDGVLVSGEPASAALIQRFSDAIASHRFWNRPRKNRLAAARDETRGRAPIPAEQAGRPVTRR